MANTQTAAKRDGLSRGKAVLIAGLAVALIGVLYVQYGRSGSAAPNTEPKVHRSRRACRGRCDFRAGADDGP